MIKFELNGFEFISCDYKEASKLFVEALNNSGQSIISHLNLYNLYLLSKGNYFKDKLWKNNIFFVEGVFLKTFMFIKYKKDFSDINGTDLSKYIFPEFRNFNKRIFLLGAKEHIIEKTKELLIKDYGLNIVGCHQGYFVIDDEVSIVEQINFTGADILISGMGMAKEMQFIANYRDKLNVKVIWNVGGLFDFLSGQMKRAPEFIRMLGLEWLFRLVNEPKDKFFRNVYPPIWFVLFIIKSYIRGKVDGN